MELLDPTLAWLKLFIDKTINALSFSHFGTHFEVAGIAVKIIRRQ